MPSEATRGLSRIIANYVRLGTNLALGIALIPVLLQWLGDDAVGVFLLLGAATALPAIFRELINRGITRELGAALHDDDPEALPRIYNSCLVVSAIATVLAAAAFAGMTLIVPLLKMPRELVWPAQVMVISQGIYLCLFTLVAPAFNMMVVAERFMIYNAALILERAGYLVAALMLWRMVGMDDSAAGLAHYGIWSSVLRGVVLIAAVAWVIGTDRRLLPSPRLVTRPALRSVATTFGWNSGVQLAMNLHERVAMLIMNLAFGIVATAAFGVAIRFVSYVRMVTVGVTFGLEAVSARMSSKDTDSIKELMHHSTRLQAFVVFPAAAVIMLLCEPLLRVWLGGSLENPEQVLPLAVSIGQVLVVAITIRALGDAWIVVLYGAGFVRRYAPLVMAGGIANPVIALTMIWLLPEQPAMLSPAISFAAVMIVVHLALLPVVGARCLGVSYWSLYTPFVRPLIATLACVPLVVAGKRVLSPLGLLDLILVTGVFGAAYGAVGWWFVLTALERRRFGSAILRRSPVRLGRSA